MIFSIYPKTILLILVLFGLGLSSLKAQSVTHKVQDDETLFSIAQKYQVSVQQLKKWNNITGNTISIGQVLIVTQKNEKRNKSETYTVKPNDTLFSIAKKFGISIDELKRWNNLKGAAINVGQVLRVKPKSDVQSQSESTVKPVSSAEPPPVKTPADGYYAVKSGDTLFRIAQLFGMEVEKLKTLNKLKSNNIHVGQKLKVKPVSTASTQTASTPGAAIRYKLKQGMGLKELLRIFEMTEKQFATLNPDMKATYINKGQTVRIIVPQPEKEGVVAAESQKLTLLGTAVAVKFSAGKKGTVTTNGELYNPKALTAAHATMAIGSVIFVKNKANNRGIIVRINDRITEKGLKLSKAAWQALGLSEGENQVIMYRIDE